MVKLNSKYASPKFLIVTSLAILSLAVLFSALGIYGTVLVPLVAVLFAFLLINDSTPKRALSVAIGIASVIPEIALGSYSVNALFAVLIGAFLVFAVSKHLTKGETSVYITVILALLVFINIILLAMDYNGSLSPSMAFETVQIKLGEIISYISTFDPFLYIETAIPPEMMQDVVIDSSPDVKYYYFETVRLYLNLSFGFITALLYLIGALCVKAFDLLLFKLADATEYKALAIEHFKIPKLLAGVYIAILVLSFFCMDTSAGAFELIICNLNFALIVPFVYVGLRSLYMLLSARFGSAGSVIAIIVLLYFMTGLVYYILAFAGAVISIIGLEIKFKRHP